MTIIQLYNKQKLIRDYFTSHSTQAFAFDLIVGKSYYYTVRKTPGVLAWEIYALSPHGKEYFIGAYYYLNGAEEHTFDLTPEPSVTRWYHENWSLLNAFLYNIEALPGNTQIRRLGICNRCGKVLTDCESIARGYGPECFKHTMEDKCEHNN